MGVLDKYLGGREIKKWWVEKYLRLCGLFDEWLEEEKGEGVLNPTGNQAPSRIVVSSKDYKKN